MKLTLLALAAALAGCGGTSVPPRPTADLVFLNGDVVTMDPLRPKADALAVVGDKIEVVGTAAEVKAWIGEHTRVVDLGGRAVTPGLVDGHCHLYGLGQSLEQIDLRGLASPEATAAKIAEAAKTRPKGEWIRGYGWDQNRWPGQAFPSRALLDAAAPDHPVLLERIDGHASWVNGRALDAARIDEKTADPTGGKIVRDPNGAATGIFIDTAMMLVEKATPADSPAVRRRKILAAIAVALRHGITGVHEMGIDDTTVAVYRELAAENALPIRVWALLQGADHIDQLASRKAERGSGRFVLGGVKLYADGALGSRGALLLEPYSDDPKNTGLVIQDRATLERAAKLARQGGWQMAVHAIGDRGNRNVLDAFEAAGVTPGDRFRVEHAQILAPEDIPRFAKLGIIASMQPTHATSDMPWAGARVGATRIQGAYAWRSLLDQKAVILGGSDFPVEEVPILYGIGAAVSRQDRSGKPEGGWHPEQRVSLEEALRMFTVAPAFASFQEHQRGRIVPGFAADLTVFDRALYEEGAALYQTRVDMTIVEGKIAFEREPGK
jgi:predicted amidohydrolase YtcJ